MKRLRNHRGGICSPAMMRMRTAHVLGCALIVCAKVFFAASAQAQTVSDLGNIALNKFEPSPASDLFLGVPSPGIGGHLAPSARISFDMAMRPLVLKGGEQPVSLVATQGIFHMGAALPVRDAWLVSADFPLLVFQNGENPMVEGKTLTSPSGAAAGDLRLGARVRFFGDEESLFQAAAGVYFHLPTGSDNQFVSDGTLRDAPYLTVGGAYSIWHWSASAGVLISGSKTNPSSVTYSIAAAALLNKRLFAGIELYAATALPSGNPRLNEFKALTREQGTNAELLFNIHYLFISSMNIGAASAIGLGDAIGTPAIRSILSISYHFDRNEKQSSQYSSAKGDDDDDGIVNESDVCPYAYGPANEDRARNGCPFRDVDEDGVVDEEDACPEQPGEERGCPRAQVKAIGQ